MDFLVWKCVFTISTLNSSIGDRLTKYDHHNNISLMKITSKISNVDS